MKRILIVGAGCALISLLVLGECQLLAAVQPQGSVGSGGNAGRILGVQTLAADTLSETGRALVGISADIDHFNYICSLNPTPYLIFYAYVWWFPNAAGMTSAEFKIEYSGSVYVADTDANPAVSAQSGSIDTGVKVTFSECQTGWVWSHRLICVALNMEPGEIEILAHPQSGECRITTCEPDHPYAPAARFESLKLNQGCWGCWLDAARIWKVTPLSSTSLEGLFTGEPFEGTTGVLDETHLVLYSKTDPPDTIAITGITREAPDLYALSLASEMQDGTTYVLEANDIACYGGCCCYVISDSKREFAFYEADATLLQSFTAAVGGSGVELRWELSEVDVGAAFLVSRSENGADFVALGMTALEKDGLAFRYVDSGVEPGKRYVYKVEYTIDGASRLLFMSEEVRVPVGALALHQNRPNPFNPSTMISFSLPAECAVRLELYDVSGRLVARLIDGERQSAGTHDVEWNGRDVSGRPAASGIYVYRLVAGKETISRKMVLLR